MDFWLVLLDRSYNNYSFSTINFSTISLLLYIIASELLVEMYIYSLNYMGRFLLNQRMASTDFPYVRYYSYTVIFSCSGSKHVLINILLCSQSPFKIIICHNSIHFEWAEYFYFEARYCNVIRNMNLSENNDVLKKLQPCLCKPSLSGWQIAWQAKALVALAYWPEINHWRHGERRTPMSECFSSISTCAVYS